MAWPYLDVALALGLCALGEDTAYIAALLNCSEEDAEDLLREAYDVTTAMRQPNDTAQPGPSSVPSRRKWAPRKWTAAPTLVDASPRSSAGPRVVPMAGDPPPGRSALDLRRKGGKP